MRHVKLLATTMALIAMLGLNAQVSINNSGTAPDGSAMLDVQSTDKGMLIPRMTSTERSNISNPAAGLIVYDLTTSTYWYYDQGQWNEIRNGNQPLAPEDLLSDIEPDFSCMDKIAVENFSSGWYRDIALSGNYAFIVDINESLLVVADVSIPEQPVLVGSLNIGPDPLSLAVSGNHAYVVDFGSNDLKVIDISDPANPSPAGNLSLGDYPTSIAVSGNYAYVVDMVSTDLKIIDISNPSSPIPAGSIGIPDIPTKVTVSGNYAYVLSGVPAELKIIDVSNPTSPTLAGSLFFGSLLGNIEVQGEYAYITGVNSEELKIVNVGDPANPTLAGSKDMEGTPNYIAVAGQYAYVNVEGFGTNEDTLKVVDISNPASPWIAGSLYLDENNYGLAVAGKYAYCINSSTKDFMVIELICPGTVTIDPLTNEIEMQEKNNIIAFGDIPVGVESFAQNNSNQAGNGFVTTPWLYTSAIEAQSDRDFPWAVAAPTLIAVGDEGNFSDENQIHLVTAGSSRLMVDVSGNVGIGTTTPDVQLHLSSQTINQQTGLKLTQGTANSLFHHNAEGDLILRKSNKPRQLVLDSMGGVGIDTTHTDGSKLYVNGDTELDGKVIFTNGLTTGAIGGLDLVCVDQGNGNFEVRRQISSRRYKENIRPFEAHAERLLDIPLKSWTAIGDDSGRMGIGYIAEEIDAAGLGELVLFNSDGMVESLNFNYFPFYNMEVIKKNRERIIALEEENEALRKQLDEINSIKQEHAVMKAEIEAIRETLNRQAVSD